MRTTEITVQQISEMYGDNAERIIAAAEQMGIETLGSWYVAAQGLAAKANQYAALEEE